MVFACRSQGIAPARFFGERAAADHQPLALCLVSDFTMPEPRTPQAIDAATAASHAGLLAFIAFSPLVCAARSPPG